MRVRGALFLLCAVVASVRGTEVESWSCYDEFGLYEAASSAAEAEASGDVTLGAGTHSLGSGHYAGWRFAVGLAPNPDIIYSYVLIHSNRSQTAPAAARISLVDAADHAGFGAAPRNVSGQPLMGGADWFLTTPWDANAWYETPHLASLVQFATSRPGWAYGGHLAFVVGPSPFGIAFPGTRDWQGYQPAADWTLPAPYLYVVHRSPPACQHTLCVGPQA